jgi:hypothetical protein
MVVIDHYFIDPRHACAGRRGVALPIADTNTGLWGWILPYIFLEQPAGALPFHKEEEK